MFFAAIPLYYTDIDSFERAEIAHVAIMNRQSIDRGSICCRDCSQIVGLNNLTLKYLHNILFSAAIDSILLNQMATDGLKGKTATMFVT